jgi:hypothetical protein
MTKSSLWKKRAWEELYKKYKKKDIKNLEEKMNLTQN